MEDTLKLAREVLASWDDRAKAGLYPASHLLVNGAHLPMVYGFAAHTHELATDVIDLLERGRVLTAYPLARLVYECALTAQWAALNPGAPQGIANEMSRLQRSLSRDLSQATSDILREGAGTLPYENANALVSAATAAARNFRDMCVDLKPAGVDAYVYFRMMSQESHASVQIADYYVIPPEDDNSLPPLRHKPRQPDGEILAGFTAYSMVWAGSAFDYLLAGRPRRSLLEAYAAQLGIPAMMKLDPVVGQRQFELDKAAKLAAREVGRRRRYE